MGEDRRGVAGGRFAAAKPAWKGVSMGTVTDAPRHRRAAFPGPGTAVRIRGRRGRVVGKEFDALHRSWFYRVEWADSGTDDLMPMAELMEQSRRP